MILARQLYRHRRLACALGAFLAFAFLFMAAKVLSLDLNIAGFKDDVIRPVAHFTGFGTLAIIIAYALGHRAGWAWLICITVSGLDELHQLYVPGRYAEVRDWLINVVGISVFLLAYKLIAPAMMRLWWKLVGARLAAAVIS